MENIIFDTGLKEFTINNAVKVVFNPADLAFVDQVFAALEDIDKIYRKYQNDVELLDDKDDKEAGIAVFELSRDADREIREKIDALFGVDICNPTIGSMNIMTPANGLPIWANIIFALIDLFDEKLVEEKKKTNPRIQKYTEKYKRRK